MNNRQVMQALQEQLNKYPMNPGEKIPWGYEKVASVKHEPPFFSWFIKNPHHRITFRHNGEPYTKLVMLKIHTTDPLDADDRIEWLGNVLSSMQPLVDLAQLGISVVKVSDPIPLDEDWSTSIEYQEGVEITLMVNPDYTDKTQSGEITSIQPSFEITKEES